MLKQANTKFYRFQLVIPIKRFNFDLMHQSHCAYTYFGLNMVHMESKQGFSQVLLNIALIFIFKKLGFFIKIKLFFIGLTFFYLLKLSLLHLLFHWGTYFQIFFQVCNVQDSTIESLLFLIV